MQCVAVVPCLDEAATVGELVSHIQRQLPEVLVVDDGSADRTAALAQEAGAKVLRHPRTLGKGAALRSGWHRAIARGFSWVLTLDGDGQHCPEDIPAFFQRAELSSADLVIGNRMHNPCQMPRSRRLVNHWMSRRLSALAGRDLPDSQCGFRLMRLAAWIGTPCVTTHFEIESEVLLSFIRAGLRVEFVPVRSIYKQERSKIHPLRDTIRWARWWRRENREKPKRQGTRFPWPRGQGQ